VVVFLKVLRVGTNSLQVNPVSRLFSAHSQVIPSFYHPFFSLFASLCNICLTPLFSKTWFFVLSSRPAQFFAKLFCFINLCGCGGASQTPCSRAGRIIIVRGTPGRAGMTSVSSGALFPTAPALPEGLGLAKEGEVRANIISTPQQHLLRLSPYAIVVKTKRPL